MKHVLVLVVAVLGSLVSSLGSNRAYGYEACSYYSAQMMATARQVTYEADGSCRVLFTWEKRWIYSPAYNCPLDIDEVSSFGIKVANCTIREGDEVAGVVSRTRDAYPNEIVIQ